MARTVSTVGASGTGALGNVGATRKRLVNFALYRLSQLQTDADLAGIRDDPALSNLPPSEAEDAVPSGFT